MKRGESKFYSKLVLICLAVFVLAYLTFSSPIDTLTADIPANDSWSNTNNVTFNCTFLTIEDDPHTIPVNLTIFINSTWTNGLFLSNKSNYSQLINNTPYNFSVLMIPDGKLEWYCELFNGSAGGNNRNITLNYTLWVDIHKPSLINLSRPVHQFNTTQSTLDFNFSAIDNVDVSIDCNLTLDGISTFTVDNAKPSNLVIDSPVEKANKTSTFNVNWTVKDSVATYLYCNVTLDGVINNTAYIVTANGSTMNYTLRNIPQAYHHEMNVTCYDSLMNFALIVSLFADVN